MVTNTDTLSKIGLQICPEIARMVATMYLQWKDFVSAIQHQDRIENYAYPTVAPAA